MSEINHPSHYNIPGKKECIVEMREKYGDLMTAIFCLMNAYKYNYRAGEKVGELVTDDLSKMQWYIKYYEDYLLNDEIAEGEWNPIISNINKLYSDLTGGKE